MRFLGPSASLSTFRWDLIYLLAQLTADDRPGVADLTPPIQGALEKVGVERAAFEDVEDELVIATAMVNRRDSKRDRLVIAMGGVARATAKDIYARLFPRHSPSKTAKLGIDAESKEIDRILGELSKLPADDPLRQAYGVPLGTAQSDLVTAKGNVDDAQTALALGRSQLERFKLELDKLRLETHGKLVVLLKDKAEAELFFRPTTKAPSEEKAEDASAPAAAPDAETKEG